MIKFADLERSSFGLQCPLWAWCKEKKEGSVVSLSFCLFFKEETQVPSLILSLIDSKILLNKHVCKTYWLTKFCFQNQAKCQKFLTLYICVTITLRVCDGDQYWNPVYIAFWQTIQNQDVIMTWYKQILNRIYKLYHDMTRINA